MGRQLNQIIEGLSGVTAGTSTINVNLDAIEALLTTLQADVADGIIVSSGTANTNLRDGAGNAITSSTRGSQRPLSVQILDSSGNQITSFGTSDVNAKLQDGSGNAITSTVFGSTRRLDVNLSSAGTIGSAAPTNANLYAGTDGTNLRAISTDSSGRINTNINGTVPVSGTFWQATQPVSGTVNSNVSDGSGNAVTSTLDGSKRRLDVMLSSGGATGSAAPTNANLVGGTDGTNLRGIRTDTSGRVSTQIFDSSGSALTYAATGTAGTPASDVVSVQGISGGTPLPVRPRNAAVTVTAGTTSATANTSAQALASSTSRQYLLIQNISDTDMYFNFGAAATTSHLLIKSGGAGITFESGFVPTDAVNVICSAASKSYYILSA